MIEEPKFTMVKFTTEDNSETIEVSFNTTNNPNTIEKYECGKTMVACGKLIPIPVGSNVYKTGTRVSENIFIWVYDRSLETFTA